MSAIRGVVLEGFDCITKLIERLHVHAYVRSIIIALSKLVYHPSVIGAIDES